MEEDRKKLAEFIKATHKKLRQQHRNDDCQEIWASHLADKKSLTEYATYMKYLATEHWNHNRNISRIKWIYNYLKFYFKNGGQERWTEKEKRKFLHFNPNVELLQEKNELSDGKIKILDVGSCYNPFLEFEDLEVTAIDICPAESSVIKCDFTSLQVLDREITEDLHIENAAYEAADNVTVITMKLKKRKLQKYSESQPPNSLFFYSGSFDSIIFSLFLEYLPSPKQRLFCCQKAYKLLKRNGLLCIVTPDSKYEGANSYLYKLWKIALGNMGFARVKYEKVKHFHGMVFRKVLYPEIWSEDFENEKNILKTKHIKEKFRNVTCDDLSMLYIPQDFVLDDK